MNFSIISAQVDWDALTELRKSMKGITGTGYSAVMRWIVSTLDGIESAIAVSECNKLLSLAEEACSWRERQINIYRSESKDDDGHRHALKMWVDVRDKLKDVKIKVDAIAKSKFYSDNNNFEDPWCSL